MVDGGCVASLFIPPARMERIFVCDPAVASVADVGRKTNGSFLSFARMYFDDDLRNKEDEALATSKRKIRIVGL